MGYYTEPGDAGMMFYIEHGYSTVHLVQADEMALCKLYSPNWRIPQESYSQESVCGTCMAELVIWQLEGLPVPWYVWFDHRKGQLIHERMG